MAPKKKAGGKGGKKGKAGGEFALDLEESNQVLEAMKEALTAKLIMETDDANKKKASENERRFRELQNKRDLEN